MQRFDTAYRNLKKDIRILDDTRNRYVDLYFVLPELISHLEAKYKTKITLAIRGYEKENAWPIFLDAPGKVTQSSVSENREDLYFFNDHYLSKIRQAHQGDYREAFIFGKNQKHAVLVVYIKENAQEVLLLMDSIGSDSGSFIEKYTGIKTYSLILGRQVDGWSCFTEALLLGRDLTAIDKETGLYKLSNLLEKIKLTNGRIGQLPDELLKTAQSTGFIETYRYERNQRIIHKQETLDEFRARYTDKNVLAKKNVNEEAKERSICNYLRIKTMKYADIAEIQYYLNQLEVEMGRELTDDEKKRFRDLAKAEFKTQGTAVEHNDRKGLFELKENFLAGLLDDEMPGLIEIVTHNIHISFHEKIAQKYHLPLEAVLELEKTTHEVIKNKKIVISDKLSELMKNPDTGFATTEILLDICKQNNRYAARYLKLISSISIEHADLLLADTQIMNVDFMVKLLESHDETIEFYYQLFSANAYLAMQALEHHRYKFSTTRLRELTWIAKHDNMNGYRLCLETCEPTMDTLQHRDRQDILLYQIKDEIYYMCTHHRIHEGLINWYDISETYYQELINGIQLTKQDQRANLSPECITSVLDLLSQRKQLDDSKRLDIQLMKRQQRSALPCANEIINEVEEKATWPFADRTSNAPVLLFDVRKHPKKKSHDVITGKSVDISITPLVPFYRSV